jgi:hypothetical protein
MKQEPADSLVTLIGKEKVRKPLDPPPVVQMNVEAEIDPTKLYMNSPNLFCTVHLVPEDSDEPHQLADNEPPMVGTLSSSVHRLKDGSSPPAGEQAYFIFGDVSVRAIGTWRLRFTVYDIPFGQSSSHTSVRRLKSICSSPFRVVQSKDFKGPDESTQLTRVFSEQGVRLRLRKEQRQSKKRDRERSGSVVEAQAEKRGRLDDHNHDQSEFVAGPVQPPIDSLGYSTPTIPGLHDYDPLSGAVQPTHYPSGMAAYGHNNYGQDDLFSHQQQGIPESRYAERLNQHLVLGGMNGHNYPYSGA